MHEPGEQHNTKPAAQQHLCCDDAECAVSVPCGGTLLEDYDIHTSRACAGMNELGTFTKKSEEWCKNECRMRDACVSFDYGDSNCWLSSTCTNAKAIDYPGQYDLYVRRDNPRPPSCRRQSRPRIARLTLGGSWARHAGCETP